MPHKHWVLKSRWSFAYHQADRGMHTYGVMICVAQVRNDIHAKVWWYTKPIGLNKKPADIVDGFLVPVAGLEPARCRHRWILSPLRLPIPSHRQINLTPLLYYKLITRSSIFYYNPCFTASKSSSISLDGFAVTKEPTIIQILEKIKAGNSS